MSLRALLVGGVFLVLLFALIATTIYGRRLVRHEKTDTVFGNPEKALGGWHWVISGVATILLFWLYFSWDAARAFFPNAANELCQVAKVESAVIPMRTVFPFESRLLRGTNMLAREGAQLERLEAVAKNTNFDAAELAQIQPLINRLRTVFIGLASPDNMPDSIADDIQNIASRIDALTKQLDSENLSAESLSAIEEARATQPGWGVGTTEIPVLPITERGAWYNEVAKPLSDISDDYIKIRNKSPEFIAETEALSDEIKALSTGASSDAVKNFAKQLSKLLKRVDDGVIFPPGALKPVETSLAQFHDVQLAKQGSLRHIDTFAMPGGRILSGNTACSEQGSGRWLPKPSDTLASLAQLGNPDIGFKGAPLLWFKQKPIAEMVAFFVPDWVADLVPGAYPRHDSDGNIAINFKTKVLNVATGNFSSPSVPVPMGHVWDSILRVVAGLFFGILLGVPLGLLMGLSRFAKGFFDPLIELYRPVPPLAWAPLILTIFGIQDDGKIFLLFMVAFAIMVISARTGATGTQLSKIHAAHSLGASRWQIVRNVILPNSLPEILTGIRIAIGVCWGTLVAAEMLAGTTGIGFVENVARKQSQYEIIWITIIILGLLGLLFDIIMRWVITKTIPWRGKG